MDFTYATGVSCVSCCVYISLMTSGEFVRRLSGASKRILCAAYFGQYFRISRIIDYLDNDYYLNLTCINYC